MRNDSKCSLMAKRTLSTTNWSKSLKVLFALCVVLFTAANAWAGSAYSSGRAWLKGDSPTGGGKVYVSQSSTDNGTYLNCNTTESEISSSEKEGENSTTTYYFYAKANDGYKFTGWYSKNADGTYTLQTSNTTHSASVKSGAAPTAGSSYTYLDRYAGFVKVVNFSFIQPVNGSFTIKNNGTAVANYASFEVAGAVNLKATPASGYKFAGWYTTPDNGATKNYFSFATEVQPSFEDNVTIGADFIQSNGQAIFWVRDAQMYDNLSAAITAAASSSSKQIIVVGDGTVAAGNYTIPNGVTLLVPYDVDYTLKTTDPGHAYSAPTAPKVYKKLTLASDVNITVEGGGAISVSATSQGGQPYGGCVHGNYGQIDLQSGSTITMQSGSNLYCWGYITGAGEITAQSGSKVYEDFQIACWRGGSAASSMNNNSKKVFPLAQYYIQNIEAKLHLMAGASEYVWTSVSANNDAQRPSSAIQIIGSNSGLFQLSYGMLTKWYNATDDRQMYELEGNMALGSISMTVYVTINSTNYVLPLTNNMDITVKSGTMTCDQRIAVLPGAKISVEEGANVSFGAGSEIYVYDKDEWGVYNYYTNVIKGVGYLCEANYSPTCSNIHGKRLYSNMTDALIDVNGTFTTASGHLYTTSGKADIYSSNGTGKIVYSKVAQSNTETYQATQSGSSISYTSIPITPAQLHNADGSYLATAGAPAGTTIQYANGHWGWVGTWKDADGNVIKTANTTTEALLSAQAPTENPTKAQTVSQVFTFADWVAERNETNQEVVYTPTFNASPRTYTVTWKNKDDSPITTSQFGYGAQPSYSGATPTYSDGVYLYEFRGWKYARTNAEYAADAVLPEVAGDETYTALFKKVSALVVAADEIREISTNMVFDMTTVQVSGRLNVSAGTLTTTDLILEATLASSGEITGNVAATNAYFNLSNGSDGFKARTWYAIAVPWQVDVPAYAAGGVAVSNDGTSFTALQLGATFDLIYYDGSKRAAEGHSNACWKYVEDDASKIMNPGKAYMIYLASDAQTIRFTRKAGASLHTASTEVVSYASQTGNDKDANWNGIANPATFKAFLNAGATEGQGQCYVAAEKRYATFEMDDNKLMVGQPIFVQAPAAKSVMANASGYNAAPARRAQAGERSVRYDVRLTQEGKETDRLIVRANDEKEADSYTIGQDLAKISVSNIVAQMWVNRYDAELCVNTMAISAETIDFPLGIFAPKADEYQIINEQSQMTDDYTLYLTRNGEAIWNLSDAPYTFYMDKGTTTEYGLRIGAKAPQVATGIDEAIVNAHGETAAKVLINNQVFIIRGDKVYTVDGLLVK